MTIAFVMMMFMFAHGFPSPRVTNDRS